MKYTLYNWYLDTRDRILNSIIVKLMEHCYLDTNTVCYAVHKGGRGFTQMLVDRYEEDKNIYGF